MIQGRKRNVKSKIGGLAPLPFGRDYLKFTINKPFIMNTGINKGIIINI
jgi:hypothetical protein